MNEIFPCLWFNGQAVEAAEFYVSVFPNSRILQTTYYGEGMMQPAGNVLTVTLDLNGRQVMILNQKRDRGEVTPSIAFRNASLTCCIRLSNSEMSSSSLLLK